jgi:hypothetical protein
MPVVIEVPEEIIPGILAGAGRVRLLGRCESKPGERALSPGNIVDGTPSMTIASSRLGAQASFEGSAAWTALPAAEIETASNAAAIPAIVLSRLLFIESPLPAESFAARKHARQIPTDRPDYRPAQRQNFRQNRKIFPSRKSSTRFAAC